MNGDTGQPAKAPDNQLSATIDVIKRYAKQETVDPLRNAGTFVAKGVVGAALGSVGVLLLALGLLRFLQAEAPGVFRSNGYYSILALVGVLVLCLVVIVYIGYFKIVKGTIEKDS